MSLPAAVLFTFDDAEASVYENAYPILAAAGCPATFYVVGSYVDGAGKVTAANLATLNAAGWDIGNHTSTHQDLTTLSEAEQETIIAAGAAYLDGLGLTRASKHVSYPVGAYNADTLTAMENAGMLTGRTTVELKQRVPIADLHTIGGTCTLAETTTLDAAKARVIAPGDDRIVIYYGHIVDEDGAQYGWTTADFQALVDYVRAQGCRVVTISQLYAYVQAGYVWP